MDEQTPIPEPVAQPPVPEPPAPAAPAAAAEAPVATSYQGDRQPFDPRTKSPRMAAVISVVPGIGQIYIGYYVRGFVTAATFLMLVFMANSVRGPGAELFGFAAAFLWLFNVIDAGRMAALYNHAIAGARSIELPQDFKMPAMGGSIIGGAMLTGFGLIALSNTALGFDLDWLDVWWPLFPLGLGGYLLVRGVMERAD